MSKRARLWREARDLTLAELKRPRRWPLSRTIQPGTLLGALLPDVLAIIWRSLGFDAVVHMSRTCYYASKIMQPYQVPPHIIPPHVWPWPVAIRRQCVIDLADAAAHMGLLHVKPRFFFPLYRVFPPTEPWQVSLGWESSCTQNRLFISWDPNPMLMHISAMAKSSLHPLPSLQETVRDILRFA